MAVAPTCAGKQAANRIVQTGTRRFSTTTMSTQGRAVYRRPWESLLLNNRQRSHRNDAQVAIVITAQLRDDTHHDTRSGKEPRCGCEGMRGAYEGCITGVLTFLRAKRDAFFACRHARSKPTSPMVNWPLLPMRTAKWRRPKREEPRWKKQKKR